MYILFFSPSGLWLVYQEYSTSHCRRGTVVIENDLFKIAALWLFGFGTTHTCLRLLSSLKFLLVKFTIAGLLVFNIIILLMKSGSLRSCVVVKFTVFLTYFLSGFPILNIALIKTIVRSNFLMKYLTKINWLDLSRFYTTRRLFHRLRYPYFVLWSVFCQVA